MAQLEEVDLRAARDSPSGRWSAWILGRWIPLVTLLVGIPIAAVAVSGTLEWFDRPFPGFFVNGNRIVSTIGWREWTGTKADVPYLYSVVKVDGRPVRSNRDVYDYVATLPVSSPVQYEFSWGKSTKTVTIPSMPFGAKDYWLTVGMFIVCGVLSLGLGVLVGLAQPKHPAARAFFVQGTMTGFYALTGTLLYVPWAWWFSPFHWIVQTLVPATFIHLVWVFPVPRRFVADQPLWVLAPYLVAAPLIPWVLHGWFVAEPADPAGFLATIVFMLVGLVSFMAVPIYTYWENRTPAVRPQLRIVVPGILLATAVALWAHWEIYWGRTFPLNLMALSVPLFYAAIALEIVRHDAFDIDRLIKQAIVYAFVTLAVFLGSVGFVTVLGKTVLLAERTRHGLMALSAVLLVEPLRRAVQALVDRFFYRNVVDYRGTVRRVSAELTSLLDRERILREVASAMIDEIQVESFTVALWSEHGTELWGLEESRRVLRALPLSSGWLRVAEQVARNPLRPWRVPEADRELGAVLVVPLPSEGRAIGAFALGRRRSGLPFDGQDLDLFHTLAAQCAIALQNARSYEALRTLNLELEDKVKARTAELSASMQTLKDTQAQLVHSEKMASLGTLVAGVAHEINNPVAFVVNSMDPLQDFVDDVAKIAAAHPDLGLSDATADAIEMVNVIRRGAARTAEIVRDLRSFSRMGGDQPEPIDLRASIDGTLRLLKQRWDGRIEIHWDVAPHDPIEGVPGQLNQVFMNVLANACDAIPGMGHLWIGIRADGEGVLVTIRDDGVGISPANASRAFEPFFTTKPPGEGTGLGLAIAHTIVMEHGGRIHLAPAPDRGTIVEVWLRRVFPHSRSVAVG